MADGAACRWPPLVSSAMTYAQVKDDISLSSFKIVTNRGKKADLESSAGHSRRSALAPRDFSSPHEWSRAVCFYHAYIFANGCPARGVSAVYIEDRSWKDVRSKTEERERGTAYWRWPKYWLFALGFRAWLGLRTTTSEFKLSSG